MVCCCCCCCCLASVIDGRRSVLDESLGGGQSGRIYACPITSPVIDRHFLTEREVEGAGKTPFLDLSSLSLSLSALVLSCIDDYCLLGKRVKTAAAAAMTTKWGCIIVSDASVVGVAFFLQRQKARTRERHWHVQSIQSFGIISGVAC